MNKKYWISAVLFTVTMSSAGAFALSCIYRTQEAELTPTEITVDGEVADLAETPTIKVSARFSGVSVNNNGQTVFLRGAEQ